jgi:hypothetical protein
LYCRIASIKELREAGLTVNSEARKSGGKPVEAANKDEEQYEDPETVMLLQHKVRSSGDFLFLQIQHLFS